MRVLYLSYDGLLEPLGQSQVWQYLQQLAKSHQITLVTFEKAADWCNSALREGMINKVKSAQICWVPLRYHKSPELISTFSDLVLGFCVSLYLALRRKIKIVHARSYVAALLAMMLKALLRVKFIFDMRGFLADERADARIWKRDSWSFKLTKYFERRLFNSADTVVSLTHNGVQALRESGYLKNGSLKCRVIPTCTNLDIFKIMKDHTLVDADSFSLGYAGTVTGWYLFDPVMECFKYLQKLRPRARVTFLNKGEHGFILERIKAFGFNSPGIQVKYLEFNLMAGEINQFDAGIFFIRPVFSKRASSPTKLGEFLACGVPCLTNSGVGDMDRILTGEGVGIMIKDFSPEAYQDGVKKIVALAAEPGIRNRCALAAKKYFSLQEGIILYDSIYSE
ncbi:MAG TPA: glycosyltransferase [Candidatus Omnitrophica bacterium]|nr:glycosyltransferase [Candidatus Omnitrophota bacterium]